MVRSKPNPSLFIPRLHCTLSERAIREVIENTLGQGTVGNIEIEPIVSPRGYSSNWNRVYIYINSWLPHAHSIRDKLLDSQPVYIDCLHYVAYGNYSTWRCFLNTKPHFKHQYPTEYVSRDCNSCGELVSCPSTSRAATDQFGLSATCNNCSSQQLSMFNRWAEPIG